MQLLDDVESTLAVQLDVDERDVGAQIGVAGQRLLRTACDADDVDSGALEDVGRGVAEIGTVVDDQTAHGTHSENHTN